ncbi:hypothetical protein Adt_04043 [Abeliophyllum distichum]|uniref:Uncharacterized protein n=1 Tax=Abeliophyllum distichum TaxID=126358 RepID=A0ABD1W3L2_9LAMI
MADVMSHRDDGVRDPPHQLSHRLTSTCESAPLPKRRGISQGINLEKVWQANGKMPLPIVSNAQCSRSEITRSTSRVWLGTNRPYGEMSTEDWQKCIDFFTSLTFVDNLVELIETQHTQAASSGASLDERAIAKEVLGERRGHVYEVGWVPKGTFPSLDSTTASKAPQGTFHQFFGDPQNNDPRFAMYEAQLRRMQREI